MIRMAQWGVGNMGKGVLNFVLDRPKQVELVGAIDAPAREGESIAELLGRPCDVTITADYASVLAKQPDVVVICTASNLHEIDHPVRAALNAGCNVICIAETMAYPWASDPQWADEIDALAKTKGVSIMGTGVNPGFVLDALVVAWTSMMLKIDKITAARINDLSPFGKTVMLSQGVGTTVEQFNAGIADGSIVGHIGFPESVGLIAKALGWTISRIEEAREPIVSEVERETPVVHVAPGEVCGCRHTCKAYDENGVERIELIHPQQIHPHLANVTTGDYVTIEGDHTITMANTPEQPGGIGTYASVGNYLPLIVDAKPGIQTVVDLPIPRYWSIQA